MKKRPSIYRNSAVIGQLGVAIAQQRLLECGYGVAVPLVPEAWDLLAYRRRKVWRIEVKATASATEGSVQIRRGSDKRLRYCAAGVDAVMAVHVLRRESVCVPMRWLEGRSRLTFSTFRDFAEVDLSKARPHKRRCHVAR